MFACDFCLNFPHYNRAQVIQLIGLYALYIGHTVDRLVCLPFTAPFKSSPLHSCTGHTVDRLVCLPFTAPSKFPPLYSCTGHTVDRLVCLPFTAPCIPRHRWAAGCHSVLCQALPKHPPLQTGELTFCARIVRTKYYCDVSLLCVLAACFEIIR